MTTIDFHNHVWPDTVAARALARGIPEMPLCGDGTVARLRTAQREAGIDLSVCLGIANTADRVATVNAYIGGLDRAHFVPFGTVHPGLSVEENLRHLRDNAVRGVKLHPTFPAVPPGRPGPAADPARARRRVPGRRARRCGRRIGRRARLWGS